MKKALLLLVTGLLLLAVPAQAHYQIKKPEPYAKMTLKEKHRYLHSLQGHARVVKKNARTYRQLVWHRKALKRINRRLDQVHRQMAQTRRPYIDSCLYKLIIKEASGFRIDKPSTWAPAARKPNSQGSGAYGVPQALPGSKMASAGRDWATNPWTQIRWMIGYVNGRYGGSCSALAYHNSNGYY